MIAQPDREQPQAPTGGAAPLSPGRLVALSVFGILVGLAVTAAVVAAARRRLRCAGGPAGKRAAGA